MHELGVVFYVVKDVKKVAEENHVEKVSAVTLEIGEVSGILHDYLTDCWNWEERTAYGRSRTENRADRSSNIL